MSFRLPPQPGEWIDRSKSIPFLFEGRRFKGFAGDTVTSALLASGVRILGRSFKYHRPRGVFSLSGADANVMLESSDGTNLRGDEEPLRHGLDLKAVNTLGGVQHDLLAILGRLSAFTPVGFYYKALHTPRAMFPLYERGLRRLAGLGRVRAEWRSTNSPKDYAFCDVLVVGAGPAGVAAANTAASCGARVILVESSERLHNQSEEPIANSVSLRLHTTCVGVYGDRWVALSDRKHLTKVRPHALVVAAGCQEQPAVFVNNDLPGVMLGDAARQLVERYAVCPTERPLVLTAGSEGYRLAHTLQGLGKQVAAVVDLRDIGSTMDPSEKLSTGDFPLYLAHAVCEAKSDRKHAGVTAARIRRLTSGGRPTGPHQIIPCDGILVCVGLSPRDGLLRQAGSIMSYDKSLHRHIPYKLPPGVFAAGSLMGADGAAAVFDGRRAGHAAADHLGLDVGDHPEYPIARSPTEHSHPFPIFSHGTGKAFVDFDEDLTIKDIANAVQEGYDSSELLKRYATVGMGPSQGKHANLNALRLLSKLTDRSMNDSRLTTARPFSSPVPMAHLAGRNFTPRQHTPTHSRHELLGAELMYAGNWMRPAYYHRPGLDREECIDAEAISVRSSVGLIDLGTLGKLEISGADAAHFIERIYTGRFAGLKVGMTRYGVMCDESGIVIDDGVVARLGPEKFYVSTTSSGADQVYRELQRWAAIWRLQVTLVNATNAYGAFNIAGPRSRQVLTRLTDIDLDPILFPYLGIREGTVAGAPARLSRVGFVGELGYEVHVPTRFATIVWDYLLRAGAAEGIVPFGVEAQRMLRLEKGHVIVSQDTDGLTDPFEANLGWTVKLDKSFFVGKRSLQILNRRRSRRKLVGFSLPLDIPAPLENHLIIDGDHIIGRVTSVGRSRTAERTIGLAFVPPKLTDLGSPLQIKCDGGSICKALVTATPFIDPKGLRLRS